jgi:hypothetical protein
MNKLIPIGIIAVGTVLLFSHEWRLSRQAASVCADRDALAEQVKILDERLQAVPAEIQAKLDLAQSNLELAETRLNHMATRASELERRLQAVQAQAPAQAARAASGRSPGWDSSETEPLAPRSEYLAVFPKRSRWGPEEVTGPPDTEGSGDIVTAWASARPDSGPEWLKLEYDSPVDIGEVRIRETHNPGAISKVTAFQPNGTEVVLWEGEATPAQAPNDFVVPVSQPIAANQIKVYVDSQRVPGWNEIDAVELVGKDGSRQWARNASASSTFAELQNQLNFRSTIETITERPRRLELSR